MFNLKPMRHINIYKNSCRDSTFLAKKLLYIRIEDSVFLEIFIALVEQLNFLHCWVISHLLVVIFRLDEFVQTVNADP